MLRNGKYQLRVVLHYADGTSKRQAFSGTTQRECRKRADDAQKLAGAITDHGNKTTADWLTTWVASHRANATVAPRTLEFYENYVRRHLVPRLGKVPVVQLTAARIQAHLDGLLADGLGVPTVQGARRTLSAALTRAAQLGIVDRNPIRGGVIRVAAHRPSPAPHLEPSELAKFFPMLLDEVSSASAHGPRMEALALLVGVTTGIRNSELMALDWPSVEVDPETSTGRIHISRVLQRVTDDAAPVRQHTNGQRIQPKKFHVGPPKSGAGDRWIELFPEVAAALFREHERQRSVGWTPLAEGDLVFRTRQGGPLTHDRLHDWITRACDRAGIQRRSFYALRRTVASMAISAGESDVSVANLMGHADVSTTKDVYARMFEEKQVARMEKLRAEYPQTA